MRVEKKKEKKRYPGRNIFSALVLAVGSSTRVYFREWLYPVTSATLLRRRFTNWNLGFQRGSRLPWKATQSYSWKLEKNINEEEDSCCEILHSPISIWERLNLLGCKNVRRTFRLIFPEKLTLYVIIYGGVIFFSRFHRVRLRWKKKIPILKNLRPFKWISLERAVSLLPFRSEFLNKWILGPPTWVDLSRNNFQRRVAEKINKNNKIKDKKRKRGKKKKNSVDFPGISFSRP